MMSCYHQVPLPKESRDMTYFIPPYGKYLFKHQSMGMKNSWDDFCHATEEVINLIREELKDPLSKFMIHKYIEDISMKAGSKENLEIPIKILNKHCGCKIIKISMQNIQLGTNITFGGREGGSYHTTRS